MKVALAQALIQGLGALHQVRQNTVSGIPKEITFVLSSAVAKTGILDHAARRLDDFFFGDSFDDDMMGGDDMFSTMMGGDGDELFEDLAQCGIDLNQIMGKMMMEGMMGGGEGGDSFMAKIMNGEEVKPEDVNPQELFDFFGGEDEEECTVQQQGQLAAASTKFLSCTGWDVILDKAKDYDYSKIMDKCDPSTAYATAMSEDETASTDFMNDCLDAVLGGDSPFGELLRDIFLHPDKNCPCFAALGEAIPECALVIPGGSGQGDLKVPGSLLKTETCLIGLVCDKLDDLCLMTLESADECLPPMNDNSKSCEDVAVDCDDDPDTDLVVPSWLPVELPDACQRVAKKEMASSHILERTSEFMDRCIQGGYHEEGTETSSTTKSGSTYTPPSEEESPTEVSSSFEEVQEQESEDDQETKKKSAPWMAIGLVAVVGAAVAAFFIRKKNARNRREQFTRVGLDDLELSEPAMSGTFS